MDARKLREAAAKATELKRLLIEAGFSPVSASVRSVESIQREAHLAAQAFRASRP